MPSIFSGLVRALTWADFPRQQEKAPAADVTATAAFTSMSFAFSLPSVQAATGTGAAGFRLADNLTVKPVFTTGASFVKSWVFARPAKEQTDLLAHEQGHYNITALIARDYFVDVMLLKAQSFPTAQAGLDAVGAVQKGTLDKVQSVHDLYDADLGPEQDDGETSGPIQKSWNANIQLAFTQPRAPSTAAPDGVLHKVRLIDVLNRGSKRI